MNDELSVTHLAGSLGAEVQGLLKETSIQPGDTILVQQSGKQKLRIGTWNVERPSTKGWKKPLRNPVIMEQLKAVNADIWILTETHEVIVPGAEFVSVSSVQAEHHNTGESSATIWSKYPIVRQIETFEPQVAVCVEIQTPVGNILVYGTIITYAHDKGPTGDAKLWQRHYQSILEHEKDWIKLNEYGLPLCVAGDFNETLNDLHYYGTKKGRQMLEQALSNSALNCLTCDYRIDHICLTQNWCPTSEVSVWDAPEFSDKPVSDHWGYHCDLFFAPPA